MAVCDKPCNNKTSHGYCMTTVCINPQYSSIGTWQYSQAVRCPKCGGMLSEVREYKGERYRHCYACHSEFFLDGEHG